MAASFASSEDYELRTGQTLDAQGKAQVSALLGEASELIREHSPGIDDRVTAGSPAPTLVAGITVRMVSRYLANPDQASNLATGPFSRGWAAVNARGLWVTEDEKAVLNPVTASTTARGVGNIRVGTVVGTARSARCLPPWV
jgi:hypothetical protein